jgi:hypothetical protein
MADIWVLLLIAAFFAVCVAFVRGCDRIIGGDDDLELEATGASEAEVREAEPARSGR